MPIKLPFRPRRDAYPADLWTKCPNCSEMLFNKQLDKALRVCTHCGHHFRLGVPARLELLLDEGTFVERDAGLESVDPLEFVDQKPYPDRVAAAQLATGLRDALVWGTGTMDGRTVAIAVMDFSFMGGSMGAVVGEKVARAAEAAIAERLPLVIVSASGGARMQEGTLALMQLVKTVAAIERLRAAGLPYLSILTDPTTGGVFASFSVLGDINLAEPDALIGFAGARVQAGTIAQELPPGFQRAEFLFRHGFVDRVVPRADLRAEVIALLRYLAPPIAAGELDTWTQGSGGSAFKPFSGLISALTDKVAAEPVDATARPGTTANGAVPKTTRRATGGTSLLNGRAPRGSGRPATTTPAAPAAGSTSTSTTKGQPASKAASTPKAAQESTADGPAAAPTPATAPAPPAPAATPAAAPTPAASPASAPTPVAVAAGAPPSRDTSPAASRPDRSESGRG